MWQGWRADDDRKARVGAKHRHQQIQTCGRLDQRDAQRRQSQDDRDEYGQPDGVAHRLDELVRADPYGAYEPEFVLKLHAAGALEGIGVEAGPTDH